MSDEKEYALSESTAKDFVCIPEGLLLNSEVVKVEERDNPWFKNDDGTPQREINFRFKVTDGEYAGRILFGKTPTTFTDHPDCKFRVWVQEILGIDALPKGFKFGLDVLVGMPVRVGVGNRPGKKNADGTDGPIRDFAESVARPKNPAGTYVNESF